MKDDGISNSAKAPLYRRSINIRPQSAELYESFQVATEKDWIVVLIQQANNKRGLYQAHAHRNDAISIC